MASGEDKTLLTERSTKRLAYASLNYETDRDPLDTERIKTDLPGEHTFIDVYGYKLPAVGLAILLSVFTVICKFVSTTSLPVYLKAIELAGSDMYFGLIVNAMWYPVFYSAILVCQNACYDGGVKWKPNGKYGSCLLLGLMYALHMLLLVYASLPSRTPPFLSGILGTSMVPFTAVCRYVILRKWVGWKRLLCTGIVMIGLFVSLIPEIFQLHGTRDTRQQTTTTSSSVSEWNNTGFKHNYSASYTQDANARMTTLDIMWPLIYILSYLPYAMMHVIYEREFRATQLPALTLLFWSLLFNAMFIITMFWTDIIPFIGMARSLAEFWSFLRNGFYCTFSPTGDPLCYGSLPKYVVQLLSGSITTLLPCLLVKYTEGAIYAVLVMSIVTPIVTLFWTLVIDNGRTLVWNPQFNLDTIFALVGLAILLPATALYMYISKKEESRLNEGGQGK